MCLHIHFLHTSCCIHLFSFSSVDLICFPFFLRISLPPPPIVPLSMLFYHEVLFLPRYCFHLVHRFTATINSASLIVFHRFVNYRLVCIAISRCISRFPSLLAFANSSVFFHTKLLFLANQLLPPNSTATRITSLFNSQLPILSYIYPK